MKFIISLILFSLLSQGPGKAPIQASRDTELEKESAKSLEVAKFYYYKRKPEKKNKEAWDRLNKSIEDRLTEILDTNPTFARTDDVHFMLGEIYNRMGEKDKAIKNWTVVVKESGDEKLKESAQKRIGENPVPQQQKAPNAQQKIQKKGR